MKRFTIPILVLTLTLFGCDLQKPWSPEDDPGLEADDLQSAGVNTLAPVKTDIGDAEQGIWLEGRLAAESAGGRITSEEIENRRDRLAIVNITVPTPAPDELWVEYAIKVTRNFEEAPVVLRAAVMVEDTPAGELAIVVGANARNITDTLAVDLFSIFDQVPETFLATVKGELLLMPEGTDEYAIDPATVTSDVRSEAIQANPIRVTLVPGNGTVPDTNPETAEPVAGDSESPELTTSGAASPSPADAAPADPSPAAEPGPPAPAEDTPQEQPDSAPAAPTADAPSTDDPPSNSAPQ